MSEGVAGHKTPQRRFGGNTCTGEKVFDVPVDYLLGEGKHATYDNDTIKRIEEIHTLGGNTKSVLFNLIDTYIRDAKARRAYAS